MVMPPHIHRYFQTPLVFLVGWVSEKAVAVKGKNYRRNLSADPMGRLFLCNQRNNFSGYAPYALDGLVFSRFVVSVEKTTAFRDFIYRFFEIFWNFFLKVAKRLRV